MAQTSKITRDASGMILQAESTGITVSGTGDTTLLTLQTLGLKRLMVEIKPTTQALDTFVVSVQAHPNSAFVTLTNAVTSTPAGQVVAASGTLASLAAAGTGWVLLDVQGFHAVQFSASAAADSATVTIRASGTS